MKKLLKFEFRKLLRQKSTYICFALLMVFAILSAVCVYLMSYPTYDYDPNTGMSIMIPATFKISDFITSAIAPLMMYPLFFIVLAVFISSYYCGDKSNGTIKNVLAKGYTREKVFFAKYIVSLVYTLTVTILAFFVSFIVGLIVVGNANGFDGKLILNLFCQILVVLGMHALMITISASMNKKGGSIAVNVLMTIFIPVIIMLLDMLVIPQLKIDNFLFSYLFPISVLNYLSTGGNMMFSGGEMSNTAISNSTYIASAVASIIYLVVFTLLGYLSIRKKEY